GESVQVLQCLLGEQFLPKGRADKRKHPGSGRLCHHLRTCSCLDSLIEPARKAVPDESVIIELRIRRVDAVDLLHLSRRERLFRVDAPDTLQQTLAPKDLVDAGDAAFKGMLRIEEGAVAVRDGDAERHESGDRFSVLRLDRAMARLELLDGA